MLRYVPQMTKLQHVEPVREIAEGITVEGFISLEGAISKVRI